VPELTGALIIALPIASWSRKQHFRFIPTYMAQSWLRARVGRHANTGSHCQNWVEDQLKVIVMLNLVAAADGGAHGELTDDHVVAGIASDALYNAILRFQKRQFPAQQSGFIDPGGPVLARMETLAWQAPSVGPTAAPKPSEQWGEFKSGSVQRALYQALTDGPQLTHDKVVDILWATLSNGTVSTSELADLQMLADKSRTIAPRSKALLNSFVNNASWYIKRGGPYKLATSRQIDAANRVYYFLSRVGRGRWPNLDRDEVGVGILMRLAYPHVVRQGGSSLCGPAAFIYNEVQDRPGDYVGLAIDLYEQGVARLRGLLITPDAAVRQYSPSTIDPIDWLTMASLRDSENFFFTYDTEDRELAGATTPSAIASWFSRAGYSDVRSDANLVRQSDTDNMDEASRLLSAGYRVCLLINDEMLDPPKPAPASAWPGAFQERAEAEANRGSDIGLDRHWVVMRSPIDRSGGNVAMTVYQRGNRNTKIPPSGTTLRLLTFLVNYFGYVAAKP
jgi:hypothetical protein